MKHNAILLGALLIGLLLTAGCGSHEDSVTAPTAAPRAALSLAAPVPADAVIDSARFYVYVSQTDTQTVSVHEVNQAWNEAEVTYTSFGAAHAATSFADVLVENTGWYPVNVTTQVQGWFDSTLVNHGFFFQPIDADTGITLVDSREAGGNHPFLEVFYTTWEGAHRDTLDAVADAYIFSGTPDMNAGGADSLLIGRETGADSVYQALIQFEFPVQIRYSMIGNRVWLDSNADGIHDAGESGIGGVTVNLYDCEDTLVATTATDVMGFYLFEMILAGDYYLEFIAPENHLFSPKDAGSDDAVDSDADPATGRTDCFTTLPGGQYMNLDAGLYLAAGSVGDFVWNDMNMNGLQDEGEAGMADIEVQLYTCAGVWVATTMTDESGLYLFDKLAPGEYYLEFANPFGWIFTYQDEGDDDAIDSDVDRYQKRTVCFTLAAGDEITNWDAGLFAFEGCTYSKGYWKNHAGFGPQADELSKLLPIWLGDDDGESSMAVTDAQTAVNLLSQDVYGHPRNGITKLYAQLLAAKLNIVNFANPADIHEVIGNADAFLADHDWMDWDMLGQADRQMVLGWKDMLDQYNNGLIGPGHCDDDEEVDFDDSSKMF